MTGRNPKPASNPGAEQIVMAVKDVGRALNSHRAAPFDPAWRRDGRMPWNARWSDAQVLFDPVLNHQLYQLARDKLDALRTKVQREHVKYLFPLGQGDKISFRDESSDGDLIVAFASDTGGTRGRATAYVITDSIVADEEHCEGIVDYTPSLPTVHVTDDGKPVVRLSTLFDWSRLTWHGMVVRDERDPYYSPRPGTPAQQFADLLGYGTLTDDRCDVKLSDDCGGRTVHVPVQFGRYVLVFEVCCGCWDYAADTARDNMRRATAEAWAAARLAPLPQWGIRKDADDA